jgi:hypothetical protein
MGAVNTGSGVTATLGVYGSASTWVFNVLRELSLVHYGAERVHAVFSDSVPQVLQDPKARDRHIVWKLHRADACWQTFAALAGARMVLTIRDPRDAMASIMQRFGVGLNAACADVVHTMMRVAENAADGHATLRYENRFFERPETVGALADYFGCTVSEAEQTRIFEAYTSERVKQFSQALDTLPAARLKAIGDWTRYDDVTQIHRTHIGDQRVGKWREYFDAAQQAAINTRLAPYLRAFQYD